LKGRTAAIAGGSQGIGAATAKRFAQAGADVYIIGRNAEKGQQVVNELKQAGAPRAEFIQADLRWGGRCFSWEEPGTDTRLIVLFPALLLKQLD
jgi:NAD(P)-dependent dehydrogenase (short-subunit alcohol dehydrogenase family)